MPAYVVEAEVAWGMHRRVTYVVVGVCDPEDPDDYDRIETMVMPFYDAVDALLVARFGVCEHYPPSAYQEGDASLELTFRRLWDSDLPAGYPPPGYARVDELSQGIPGSPPAARVPGLSGYPEGAEVGG